MSKSGFDSASMVRVVILVVIVAILGAMIYYDRAVKVPQTQQIIDEMIDGCEGARSMSPEDVLELTGFAPSAVKEHADGVVVVETFRFSRGIPFLQGDVAYAMYLNDQLKKVVVNRELTERDINYVRYFNQ